MSGERLRAQGSGLRAQRDTDERESPPFGGLGG
jgi:hypothetical protein